MNNTRTFNVICGIHNHDLCHNSVDHPIICRLNSEEKKLVSEMTLNMVQPRNILATLKRKIFESISNIRQVYNIRIKNNKARRGPRYEMLQLFKLLDDDHNVSKYRVC